MPNSFSHIFARHARAAALPATRHSPAIPAMQEETVERVAALVLGENGEKRLRKFLRRLTADPFVQPNRRNPRLVDMVLARVATRDWGGALDLASSFWRFDLFVYLAPYMTRDEHREQLAQIWPSCDISSWRWKLVALTYLRQVGYIGDLPRPDTELLVYRGVYNPRHRLGLSWSTNIKTARHFVRPHGPRRHRPVFVYSAVAPPDAFLGGFGVRDEAEYIVHPSLLTDVKQVEGIPPEL